jgi:hypothetical protein
MASTDFYIVHDGSKLYPNHNPESIGNFMDRVNQGEFRFTAHLHTVFRGKDHDQIRNVLNYCASQVGSDRVAYLVECEPFECAILDQSLEQLDITPKAAVGGSSIELARRLRKKVLAIVGTLKNAPIGEKAKDDNAPPKDAAPKQKRAEPPEHYFQIYNLSVAMPDKQADLAETASKQLKKIIMQETVSKAIRRVKEWQKQEGLAAGDEASKPLVTFKDPSAMELGERTDGLSGAQLAKAQQKARDKD